MQVSEERGSDAPVRGNEEEQDSVREHGSQYDEAYFKHRFGGIPYERNDHWLKFFSGIAEELIRALRPRRVLDVGCAKGFLVEAFWDRGVEAWGIDISSYALSEVRRDMQPYCQLRSASAAIEGRFDVITCIEILEHMPSGEAISAIANMTAATDTILLSSTPNDLTEPTHINVHPVMYWLKLFSQHGFWPDLSFDATFVAPHAILFRRSEQDLPTDVLVLLCDLIRSRLTVVDRNNEIWHLKQQIADRESELRAVGRAELSQSDTALLEQVKAKAEEQCESLERELDQVRIYARQLEAESANLRQELIAIKTSPGWRAILKYRGWLNTGLTRKPWMHRFHEPAALWLLRKLGLGSPLYPPAIASTGPHGLLQPPQTVTVPIDSGNSAQTMLARSPEITYDHWIGLSEPSAADLQTQRELSRHFSWRPKFTVLVPVYKVPLGVLSEMVGSVKAQSYENWELCIAHAEPTDADGIGFLRQASESDARIKVEFLGENLGISGNSNRALEMATGEFVALLDHDDTLAPFALFEVANLLQDQPDLDFIYSDKDQLRERDGARVGPLFKPGWSPDIMLNANYLTHLSVIRTEQLRAVGGWRPNTDGAQDWDLFLRVVERTNCVAHIPKVLYHWRHSSGSVAAGGFQAKPYAAEAQLVCLREHLRRTGRAYDIGINPRGDLRVRWTAEPEPVSVILVCAPESEGGVEVARRLLAKTNHPEIEVLVPHSSSSTGDRRIRQVLSGDRARVTEWLNKAVSQCSHRLCVFYDESVEILAEDWLVELSGPLCHPEVGIVGPKLLQPDAPLIRQIGIAFNSNGDLGYPWSGIEEYLGNPAGAPFWYRNWLAVSGACFAIRRENFEAMGGFSDNPAFPRLDVDLCLKVGLELRRRILYNSYSLLSQSGEAVCERWTCADGPAVGAAYFRLNFPQGDPFFNPNLRCKDGSIQLKPRQPEATNS